VRKASFAVLEPEIVFALLRSKRGFQLHRLFFALCAVFVFLADARAESPTTPSGTLINLGTRIFDLREHSRIIDLQVSNEFVSLSDVTWIEALSEADPYLAGTVIHIKDQTRLFAGGDPTWAPDNRSRFHPDPTLPPLFDLEGYEVGWEGIFYEARPRGDILIFLQNDPQRFYARCGYDRATPKPIFCGVSFRYGPDRNLLVTTRVYRVSSPLNDFAEIAARVEALVRCLDVTEAVRAGEMSPATPYLVQKDIAAGGRCRIMPSS
jgi:hypothetical protein